MKLPHLSSKELITILKKIGFSEIRQQGSHKYLKHHDGRVAVVPMHSGKDISRGLLRKIIGEIEIDRESFLKFLRKR